MTCRDRYGLERWRRRRERRKARESSFQKIYDRFFLARVKGEEEIGRGKFSSLGKEETTALGNTLDRPVERRK